MNELDINEWKSSQLPAVQLLIAMGYEYISPEEVLKERKERYGNVILEGVLSEQLKKINQIHYKGEHYLFSEENIQTAVQKVKSVNYDGLIRTNEVIYDLITLGTALEQTIEGDTKSFNLNYIDWKRPERNVYHVTVEFSVERTTLTKKARPDIILFVNGLPLVVIECKAPNVEVEEAVAQMIENQGAEYIPTLFTFVQLVLAMNGHEIKYGTTGTPSKFWAVWKEEQSPAIKSLIAESLRHEVSPSEGFTHSEYELVTTRTPSRNITAQDEALYALCRPERLLELAWKFTVFDAGDKKIARYQQYFVVKSTLERVKQFATKSAGAESRESGVIWHTQGSGKSLTMVMLTRCLAIDPEIMNPRIVLVTDRKNLDKQLRNTFQACGLEPTQATSGRSLLRLITSKEAGIITTVVHKFEGAYAAEKHRDESSDIFVLVDESHRTQFGTFSARMRLIFPNAAYIGFTGTPLIKKDKNNFAKFGRLISPHYTIRQAVDDQAVVPLLYEGRLVELTQNKSGIDLWFDRHTKGLNDDQKADLKRKYARAEMLNKTEQVIYERAMDISKHYADFCYGQGTGYKAQLVAPTKEVALKYHEYLEDLGMVSSAVIISGPDKREGHEEVDGEVGNKVKQFWERMMDRYKSEEEYNRCIIDEFDSEEGPEILIVVDKLLTGFDVPRNTIMYLCRTLKEHNLLQAIARVNRLYEGKEFGFIVDYANVLEELDKSLTMYEAFEDFDEEDLVGTLYSIDDEVDKLPDHYSAVCDVFKGVPFTYDGDAYAEHLADEEIREDFYEKLAIFSKTLGVALASERFLAKVEEETLQRYKKELRAFHKLRQAVKLRYAEAVNFKKDYEPKIEKLLNTHIHAGEGIQLNEPVNIFDDEEFMALKEDEAIYGEKKSVAARADTIAHATKKVISENYEKDPAFYEKFSKLIQQAIDDYRAKRISDLEYLNKASDARNGVKGHDRDDLPPKLRGNANASAYYGVMQQLVKGDEEVLVDASLALADILDNNYKVNFWNDEDAQNQVKNSFDDYYYDVLLDKHEIALSADEMTELNNKILKVAWSNFS